LKENKEILLNQINENPFIEIFRFEEMDDNDPFDNYQRYDFHQLIWFTEAGGNNSYFLDFNEYIIKDGQIILVFPGQIDKLDIQGKKGYIFAIHNDVFFRINQHINSDYLNGYYSNKFISPDTETQKVLEKILELLLQEYNQNNRLILMKSYMESFLFHVASYFENTELGQLKNDAFVARLMKLIDSNFIEHRDTDFYADALDVTHKKLNLECKLGTGKTVKQHLQERLILEIKKEIRMWRKSLKEIAFDLGFSEPAYLTRFFKQHTSITPTEFRDMEYLSK